MKRIKTIRLQMLLKGMLFVWLLAGGSTAAFAQTKISGTVTHQNKPVAGATVQVVKTARYTTTNDAGHFSIEAKTGDHIAITRVGYLQKEVTVTSDNLDVQLEIADNQLENVVVIGYGSQKKKLVTGANVQVKGEDIQKQSTTDPLQALQGQAPGVQITSSSGQPGSGMVVVIRGKGTIGSFSPLYVVDGVQVGGDISYLNPNDIESIDVLKDAASAAIYGSQAANGVILVTTKSGKLNRRPQVTFDAYYGWQNVARKAQLLNAKEYATIVNEAAVNSGKDPYFTNDVINNLKVNTNWMDQMFAKNVPTQNYVLGVSGGSAASVYSLSLGYTGQGGIVGGAKFSNFDRYTFRVNSEHNLYNNIVKLGQHLTFNYQNNHGLAVGGIYGNTLRSAYNTSPFLPMYDSAGAYFNAANNGWYPGDPGRAWNTGESNPYAGMDYTTRAANSNQKLFGDIYAVIEPIKGLRFRSALGVNYTPGQAHGYLPPYKLSVYAFNDTATVWQSMNAGLGIQFDNQLSYDFKVESGHDFSVMAGSSALKTKGTNIYGSNFNLRVADLAYAYLSVAQNTTQANKMGISGGPYESALLSYFGRLQYNYQEKYLLNLTFRGDGSSNFAPAHRWGYFPSVAAGWIVSKEKFMTAVSGINFLKIRATWGRVGNQNVAPYQYLAPISFINARYNFGSTEGNNVAGAFPSRLANPDIKWETSEQSNIGFDALILHNLNITVDYYNKKTKDWLIKAPILATAGAEAPTINGGDVTNTGFEASFSYHNTIGKLQYTVNANGAYNKNQVGNIPTRDHIIHGNTNVLFNNGPEFYRAENGFPIGYFWGYKTAGIFQTEADVLNYKNTAGQLIQPNAQPGDVRYVDLNNDGIIDDKDKTRIGDPNPHYTFGFGVSLEYKGFDFLVQASGVAGNSIVQSWHDPAGPFGNWSKDILNRWHGESTSDRLPRVTEDNRNWTGFSDLYLQKGDFLRINTMTLGYDLSKSVRTGIFSRARVYASVLNAFTFTRYNGMDPEIGFNAGDFTQGVDVGYYPRPRTLLVGANIRL
ncbi:TonB-dependent receptor [Niabella sp.]|uniref:SusC/RagA family TonB-linked outer membrane protein n=1 Tax=Niabella sp. TaxID=1962976 RepID=UPI002614D7C0|nr:TonB-dependent receptor [Niabella sp.]